MKFANIVWFIIAAFVLNVPNISADDTPEGEVSKPPGWFLKLDRDGNGILDTKEAGRLLGAMDTDRDAKITVAEATAYVQRRQQDAARKGIRGGRGQVIFRAQDLENRKKAGDGLWVVSIGHSCVIPAIDPCISISKSAGYENHTHLMQFFGGGGGAPRAQWSYVGERQQAKPALASGRIDVMTFGHLVDFNGKSVGCDVEDYQRWFEFAIEHNPKIKFYIQDLWPWLPGSERTVKIEDFNLEDYEAAMSVSSRSVDSVVEQLEQRFPGRVHVLPAGLAMTELVRRVAKNDLPGVDAVLVSPKEKKAGIRVGLYRDKIHPTDLVAALQGYIYYACLYGKNPADLIDEVYRDGKLDRMLREVAWRTVTRHPLSGVKK